MADSAGREVRPAPPRARWVYRAAWALHRWAFRLTGGRLGLRSPEAGRFGVLRLRTLGRRSGRERAVLLSFLADGPDLVVVASNAGAARDPGWWRNLEASPDAYVDLPDGLHAVRARQAAGAERERLWERFVTADEGYAAYAAATDRSIPVVILEPNETRGLVHSGA